MKTSLAVAGLLLVSCAAPQPTPRPPLRAGANAPADAAAVPEKPAVAEPSVADDPVAPRAPGTHPLPSTGSSSAIAESRKRAFKQFTAPLWAFDKSRCPELRSPEFFDFWCRHACAVRLEPREGVGDLPDGATLRISWPYAEIDGPEVLIGPGGRVLECAYSGLGVPRRSMTCPARPVGPQTSRPSAASTDPT